MQEAEDAMIKHNRSVGSYNAISPHETMMLQDATLQDAGILRYTGSYNIIDALRQHRWRSEFNLGLLTQAINCDSTSPWTNAALLVAFTVLSKCGRVSSPERFFESYSVGISQTHGNELDLRTGNIIVQPLWHKSMKKGDKNEQSIYKMDENRNEQWYAWDKPGNKLTDTYAVKF